MNDAPKNSVKEAITRIAKAVVKESGFHPPRFFIELPNGTVAQIGVDTEDKALIIKAIKEVVDTAKANRYYSVFDTKLINEEDVRKKAKQILLASSKGDVDPKSVLIQLTALANKPSLNPAARDVLIISTYDKTTGMDKEMYEYTIKKDGKVAFKPGKSLNAQGNMYDAFNVWTPYQMQFGEDDGR